MGEDNTVGRHSMNTVLWETKVKNTSGKLLIVVIQILVFTRCWFGPGSLCAPDVKGSLSFSEITGWLYILATTV